MIKFLAAFFALGVTMRTLNIVLLLFPGTALDSLWRLNPDAHVAFQSIGRIAILLRFVVATGCAFIAVELWQSFR